MSVIAHIRKRVLEVTQVALAEMTGVTQATVSRWEKGELWPNHRELAIIRDAGRAKLPTEWEDNWLFEVPACPDAPPPPAATEPRSAA